MVRSDRIRSLAPVSRLVSESRRRTLRVQIYIANSCWPSIYPGIFGGCFVPSRITGSTAHLVLSCFPNSDYWHCTVYFLLRCFADDVTMLATILVCRANCSLTLPGISLVSGVSWSTYLFSKVVVHSFLAFPRLCLGWYIPAPTPPEF